MIKVYHVGRYDAAITPVHIDKRSVFITDTDVNAVVEVLMDQADIFQPVLLTFRFRRCKHSTEPHALGYRRIVRHASGHHHRVSRVAVLVCGRWW